MRDGDTTNFELKSFNASESRTGNKFMGMSAPPSLPLKLSKIKSNQPTADNLKKLGTARASQADGAKSARSRVSGRSQEPVDPWKDHTVEQMDVLIA